MELQQKLQNIIAVNWREVDQLSWQSYRRLAETRAADLVCINLRTVTNLSPDGLKPKPTRLKISAFQR